MVTSLISFASILDMNSLYAGVASRWDWPFFDTSCQSITPSSTIASQKRIVFAVELEFTVTSLKSSQVPIHAAYCFPRLRPLLLLDAAEPPEDKSFRLRSVPFGAARPYPTHIPLDAFRKPK